MEGVVLSDSKALAWRFNKALESLVKVRYQRIADDKPRDLYVLSRSEGAALTAIDDDDGINLKRLASNLMVTPGTASVTVDRLIRRNYVIRRQYEKDRRGITLHLTEEGTRLASSYRRFLGSISQGLLSKLDGENVARLVEDLEALTK